MWLCSPPGKGETVRGTKAHPGPTAGARGCGAAAHLPPHAAGEDQAAEGKQQPLRFFWPKTATFWGTHWTSALAQREELVLQMPCSVEISLFFFFFFSTSVPQRARQASQLYPSAPRLIDPMILPFLKERGEQDAIKSLHGMESKKKTVECPNWP